MKKLLCLVFVLIALLGLTFAVSATDAEKLTGLANVSKLYKSDNSEIVGGGMNGGSYMSNLFDGSYGANYNNNVGSYIVTDLNAKLPGGYYVTEIKIYHSNNSKFSLYYTTDGMTWTPIVQNAQVTEATYAVGATVTEVKFVFETCANWVASVKEIEIYGIDPSAISCEHKNLAADGWTPVPGSATCTGVGKVAQNCPDCGEEIQQVSNDVLPLGHDIVTTVTRPGTSTLYGAATLKCSRCEYSIDFSGEVNLTDGTYSSIRESEQFVNILVSSIADLWGASRIENLFTGDWENIGPFHTWVAAGEDDSIEYVMLDFKGEIDLTKLSVLVQNDSGGYLVLSALNRETGEYEEVRRLQTYDEALGGGAALRMDVPLLGVTTSALKIQVFSNWRNTNGYYYNRMVIGELEAFGIAKGCGLEADSHVHAYDEFVEYKVAPTCLTAGRAVYKCACNETNEVDVEASEEYHKYIEVEGTKVNSTCTVAGSYTGKCEYCETVKENITLDFDTENGHDFSDEVSKTDADCENAGEIVYGCANCDATKTEEIPAKGHNYQETSRTEPDCVTAGEKVSTCANCGDEKTEEIPVKGHTWVLNEDEIETEPTCGDAGFGSYYCSVCSATKEDVISATGEHTWNEEPDSITLAPTCTSTGAGEYSCAICGATEKHIIPALGHKMVEDESAKVEPTCTEKGSSVKICANGCGYTQTEEIPAENHKIVPATCTTYAACENCDYVNTEAGYAAHTWGNVACTAGNCVVCGAENPDADKVTHTYDWKIGGCPTCGTVAVPDVKDGKVSTNLGFSVFFAASWSEINANVSASSTYKVIKLTADTTVPSGNNYAKVQNANIYIDLGGHSITSSVGLAPLYLYAADALVNGKIIHNYSRQALYVCNVNLIENIDIVIGGTYANNTTGIYLAYNASYAAGFEKSTGSYIGSMKDVTIDSKRDANGNYIDNIGLFNHGIEFSNANSVIGNLENVKVYSRGQAITIMAKEIGTMTNCVFDGTNIGLNIGNLQSNINLVNCVVSSETLAVRIGGASSDKLTFNFDANTKISSDGSVYYIADSIKSYEGFETLTTAAGLVNGQLYKTLAEAIAALAASEEEVTTFTLIGDLTIDAPIEINKTVKFSYGGGTFKIPTTGDKTFTEVTVDGYTVTAPKGAFVVVEGGNLTLEGDGTLVGNENAVVVNGGTALIKAGTYVGFNPANFVADGTCAAYDEDKNSYTIAKEHDYDDYVLGDKVTYNVDGVCNGCGFVRGVAAVDYVYFATLEEAIAEAVRTGNAVVLADNIDLAEAVKVSVAVKINLNGKELTVKNDTAGDGVFHVIAGGVLTIEGEGIINGVGNNNYNIAIWADGGRVIIKSGTFTNVGAGDDDHYDLIYASNGGIVEIYGGTFKAQTPKWTLNLKDNTDSSIVVYGGTFYNYDPSESYSENPVADFTNGKCVIKGSDDYYSIVGDHKYFYNCDKVCEVCFEVSRPEAEHTIVHVDAVPATCTTNGNVEYWTCSDCGYAWADEALTQQTNPKRVIIPATGHSYAYDCDKACAVCYEITRPEAEHTIDHVDAVPATCTTNGNVEYWTCSDCGYAWLDEALTLVANRFSIIAPATGHTEEYPASCTQQAFCSVCQEYYGELAPHTFYFGTVHWSSTVSCEEAGTLVYECDNCNETSEPIESEKLGHDWSLDLYAEGAVLPTCQDTGLALYCCSRCWIYDNETGLVEVPADPENGHVWDYVNVPATCLNGGLYTETCTVCGLEYSYPSEPNPENHTWTTAGAIVDGKLQFVCACGETKLENTLVEGDNAITFTYTEWYGYLEFDGYTVYIATPGKYTITSLDAIIGEMVVEFWGTTYSDVELPYTFEVAEGEIVELTIKPLDQWADEKQYAATVTLTDVSCAHTNTVIIPAVPGELRNPGMTSGVKCADCDAIIVAPVQASGDFRIGAVALTLGENINIVYKVQVPAGYTNVYMVFEMEGQPAIVVKEFENGTDGRLWFTLKNIRLQTMADLVTATVYATNNGVESANSYSNYSVKQYIVNQLGKAANTAELKTMLSDLLLLGEKAQVYMNYKVNKLMTADVDASLLTPSTYNGVPQSEYVQNMIVNDEATRSIADWKAVSLVFKDAMTLQFKLLIDPAYANENLKIVVVIPGVNSADRKDTYTIDDLTYSASENRYILEVDNVKALQYGSKAYGDIYYNNVKISRTVEYSVNTYIQKNQDSSNTALRDFLRAVYQYGQSAYAYGVK